MVSSCMRYLSISKMCNFFLINDSELITVKGIVQTVSEEEPCVV